MGRNQFGESYTTEQREWAREYFSTHSRKETMIAFNKRYKLNKSICAIAHLCQGVKKDYCTHYTTEMENFIKEQVAIPNNTWKPITKAFNEKFNTNVRWEALKRKASSLGVKTETNRDENYTFHPKVRNQIGKEVVHKKRDGEQYIVVKVANKFKGDKANWKLKHYVVWEEHFGKVPKDSVIIFLDGNTLNCDINNLRCVSKDIFKKVQGNRYTLNYYGKGKITDAMIEILETEKLMKGVNNEIH